jgi:hypothetical protein
MSRFFGRAERPMPKSRFAEGKRCACLDFQSDAVGLDAADLLPAFGALATGFLA